nr:hypothetical protein B0A51_03196 [Rachicladosporium sp. CCFEE 5018]
MTRVWLAHTSTSQRSCPLLLSVLTSPQTHTTASTHHQLVTATSRPPRLKDSLPTSYHTNNTMEPAVYLWAWFETKILKKKDMSVLAKPDQGAEKEPKRPALR